MSIDKVNPSHYQGHAVSPIDLIESYGMTDHFCRGNIIKYIARAPEKDAKADDWKALWYTLRLLGFSVARCQELTRQLRDELETRKPVTHGYGPYECHTWKGDSFFIAGWIGTCYSYNVLEDQTLQIVDRVTGAVTIVPLGRNIYKHKETLRLKFGNLLPEE